jgi:hypothetical protein
MPCSLTAQILRTAAGTLLASLACASVALSQPTLAQPIISYDSLWKHDVETRLKVFGSLSQENKAEILTTQIQRWILKNRDRLSAAQISLLEERMALAKEDLAGRLPKTQETADRWNDLQRRSHRAFGWVDMQQIMSIRADYIPKTETVP